MRKIQMTYRRLLLVLALMVTVGVQAQINTEQVVNIGRNALYFEDYILAIQYFNQAIKAKPFLAEPYFFRSVAKISLEDYQGAEQDAGMAIERNPFIVDAYYGNRNGKYISARDFKLDEGKKEFRIRTWYLEASRHKGLAITGPEINEMAKKRVLTYSYPLWDKNHSSVPQTIPLASVR